MRKLSTLSLGLLILSCTPKPQLRTYHVSITKLAYSAGTGRLEPTTDQDTIRAVDDESAYTKACIRQYAINTVDKHYQQKYSKLLKFTVLDSLSVDLKTKLSLRKTDSIEKIVSNATASIK